MNDKKYEILEHPAELRIRVYGETIEDLFKNAVEAMAQILKRGTTRTKRGTTRKIGGIQIQSSDINSLLVDFLSEILAKSQINKKVYKADLIKIRPELAKGPHYLEAEIIGYPIERFDEDIKAVTYEDLDIKQIANGKSRNGKIWTTCLVFDI